MIVKCTLWLALFITLGAAELCTELNCNCTTTAGKTVLDCQDLELEAMPSFTKLPKNVIVIDLSNNRLNSIPVLDEIDGLKTLKLNHNNITEIVPNAFRKYNYLLHLDLCHNYLTNVTGLEGLTGLKTLNLSHNLIRSLPDKVFSPMSELAEIRLHGNPLHYVRYVLFQGLSRVSFLDLSDCELSSLPEDVFHDMISLDELRLEGNNFEEVPTAGLRSASNLKTLNLNGNRFSTIKGNSFKDCKLLEYLEISNSDLLESIEADAFSGLKLLKVLKITHNPQLKKLDFAAFQGFFQSTDKEWTLQELNLRGNGLREFRSPSTTLCKIKTLDLQENPWNCDCNLTWINSCEMKDELSSDLKCTKPPNLENKLIKELKAEDMICSAEESPEHQEKELCTDMKCTCATTTGETVINCQDLAIQAMPSFGKLPKNVIVIDLSKNKLKTIPVLNEIDGLKTMKLSHNDITEIVPNAFQKYNYLLNLDLCHNHVYNLSGLEGLTGLKSLNLSHNLIRSLPDNVFFPMSELAELRLNGNPLHYVRYGMFRALSRVSFLDLSDCALSSLPADVFHDMISLDDLHLDGNKFEEIPTAGLRSAANLKNLKLNGNQITTIKANSFKNCKLLETLEISDSGSLESIEAGAFSGLKLLKVLKITHNPHLKELDFGAFGGLYQSKDNEWILQELVLRENGLREIQSPSTTLCKIKTLDLQENPWNCDCHLTWITTCEMKDELSSNLKCTAPPNLDGKVIGKLGAENMICRPDEHMEHHEKVQKIVVVSCGLVGIIFCGIIIVIIIKKRKIMEWWYYKKRGSGAVYYVKAKSSPQDANGDI